MHEKVFWTLRQTTLAGSDRVVSCSVHIVHTVVLPFAACLAQLTSTVGDIQ